MMNAERGTLNDERIKAERGISWVYWWLFWSPLITVGWLAIALASSYDYSSRSNIFIGPILSSALPHLILLLGLRSKYLYQRRHTQQALLLVFIRLLSTVAILGLTRGNGVGLWVIANGGLWLWSSWWGLRQVKQGRCWLMSYLLDPVELPRPWAQPAAFGLVPVASAAPVPDPSLSAALLTGKQLAAAGRRQAAVERFLTDFRAGPPDLRREAVEGLTRLGEVEVF